MTEKPIDELDRLKLENLHLKTVVLNQRGELEATKTKMELDKAVDMLNATLAEVQKRYGTEGWKLDLGQGKWISSEESK